MGSWNVLSLSEDHRLSHLSDELSSLRMDIAGLSETRRPGSGETSSKGFTYYWFAMSNGHHVMGVVIGICRLKPSVAEVTPVDERIMRLRLKHSLGFMSVVTVYASTEVCETEEKEMFYEALPRWRHWKALRRVVLPDLLGTMTSTGLCHIGLELS